MRDLGERTAITSWLGIMALRAIINRAETPFWRPIERMRLRWTLAMLSMTAEQIERGEHLSVQGRFVSKVEVVDDPRAAEA